MDEVKSYYALCNVVDCLLESRNTGTVSPEELQSKIELYLIFRLDAYGVAWFPPKAHYILHLAAQLRKHGVLVSCYCHERKHKELKKYANQSHNAGATMAWEKGLLEDVLLQQHLALQEWSRRDVYMLTSPKPAHKAAYKQVPLSDEAYDMDAYLMVFNPASQQLEVFQQRVLPFGSVASVTAFLQCSSALWAIGARLLSFIWTAYFDDFLSLEVAEACRHTALCIAAFFSLLGWRVSHEKLLLYETICKVLGVQFDLRQSGDGLAWFGNTPARGPPS